MNSVGAPAGAGRRPLGRHPQQAGARVAARWWHRVEDGRLQCDVCPRQCRLEDGQRGFCFVRSRQGDEVVLTTYGMAFAFCLDPVEKKSLYHFYPGTPVLSLGTAGCNLQCLSCRTWDPGVERRVERLSEEASPSAIASAAHQWRATSVAFTYNDPAVYPEYAIDIARACHVQGIRTIAVTAGYMNPSARRDLFGVMDAANIDLKGFDDDFYRSFAGVDLRTVMDTLVYVRHRTSTWLEITNLLIPGQNDDPATMSAMCTWIVKELGADVPLHFAAFRPEPRMPGVPPTPPEMLARARDIALEAGLQYVYTDGGGIPRTETTACAGCGATLIERDGGSTITRYRLTSNGRCPECRASVVGYFGDRAGDFGARRIPIRLIS